MTKDRDCELEREIRTHLDLEAEERIANGMPEREARNAARRAPRVRQRDADAGGCTSGVDGRWLDEIAPLGYPQPEQLRMLSTGSGDGRPGPVSPAEYFELTEVSQSFSVVGAFVTGEVNLSALDRPRRASRARVNDRIWTPLSS